jgi:hypothetical protein
MCRTVEHELTSGGFLFPEVYLVEGGYEAIFKAMPHHCTPSDYVVCGVPYPVLSSEPCSS